jgi:hypothetical protein
MRMGIGTQTSDLADEGKWVRAALTSLHVMVARIQLKEADSAHYYSDICSYLLIYLVI